jgi:hypothetical protein
MRDTASGSETPPTKIIWATPRSTNEHSNSLRHNTAMQPMFAAWYNFARKHETLRGKTPAMASQLTDHVWTIKELIERAA